MAEEQKTSNSGSYQKGRPVDRNNKNFVGIVEYLEHMGHTLKPHGRKGQFTVDDHQSLVVTPSKDLWNSFKSREGGGVRQLMAFLDNITDKNDQNKLLKEIRSARGEGWKPKEYDLTDYDSATFNLADHKFNHDTPVDTLNYLTKVRGLHPKIVDQLFKADLIREEVKEFGTSKFKISNVWFSWKDRNHQVVGADTQGTKPKKGSGKDEKHQGYFHGIAAGSRGDEACFHFNIGPKKVADKMFVFEAAIDAISYWQMNYEELKGQAVEFVALSGVKMSTFQRHLQDFYTEDEQWILPKEIHLAVDNDEAGRLFAMRAGNLLSAMQKFDEVALTVDVPMDLRYKDWNDALRYGKHEVRVTEFEHAENVPLYVGHEVTKEAVKEVATPVVQQLVTTTRSR